MVGARIKEYLNAKGIKQVYVAEKTGLTPTQLSNIFNKNEKINVVEYAKICKALDVSLDTFLEGIE